MVRERFSWRRRILASIGLLAAVFLLGAIGITILTNQSQYQSQFEQGTKPSKLQGFYRGTPLFVFQTGGSWQGKRFNTNDQTGDNYFGNEEYRYPFKTYATRAMGNDQIVLHLDYNLPENPWYVKIIQNELVQIDTNKYLGKLYISLIPYFPIAVGFFELEKAASETGGCIISGCSQELCSDQELYSICSFKPEYTCYRNARCERQKNGTCGWTQTNELTKCILNKITENVR